MACRQLERVSVGRGVPKPSGRLTSSVPCRAVPCRAVPCRAVPCRAVPCRAVPCRAVPCRAVPCRAVPCRAVPSCAVPIRSSPGRSRRRSPRAPRRPASRYSLAEAPPVTGRSHSRRPVDGAAPDAGYTHQYKTRLEAEWVERARHRPRPARAFHLSDHNGRGQVLAGPREPESSTHRTVTARGPGNPSPARKHSGGRGGGGGGGGGRHPPRGTAVGRALRVAPGSREAPAAKRGGVIPVATRGNGVQKGSGQG
ncbi:hypothetical protein QFZ50_003602 [Arthrobacter agilis]|nr:hypothetical protein [Arthrobacter agilis]